MAGLDRFIAFDKVDFIGREAALAEREGGGPSQRLVLLAIDDAGADVTGFEPVWSGNRKVGFVTSGAYGHHVKQSLALAYLERAIAEAPVPVEVHVVGERRPARILAEPPYDPKGLKPRS
jgi:dimethylglycine dehydrogenase